MSGRSRSTSRTVGTNSTARARAAAPVCATRVSPYPDDCSKEARALAASTSSSTISMRGISPGGPPSCCLECVPGRGLTADCSAKAHRTRVRVARFEGPDLPLGLVAGDAVGLLQLLRKTHPPTRNRVEVIRGEPPPVSLYLNPERLPAGFDAIPVHLVSKVLAVLPRHAGISFKPKLP